MDKAAHHSLIRLENVDFFYDQGKPNEMRALKDISLDIAPGDYAAFFGPSGCGKSTLLYVLSGIDKPTSGKVIIEDKDIALFDVHELALFRQTGIGVIFQNFNLIPSLNVIDNVALPMAFLGIPRTQRKEHARAALERVGLAELAKRYPFELSGGQQQRVGIARALVNNPPIIVADEPLGNLDSDNANAVLNILRELNQKDGKTIIMVTHEAWSLKDVNVIFYMRDGAITKSERKAASGEAKTGTLYRALYPELAEPDIKAKAIAQTLLRGYSQEETKRFETFVAQLLKKEINEYTFRSLLDKPFKEGGVGLWKQKATRLTEYVARLIVEAKEIAALMDTLAAHPQQPLKNEIESLRARLVIDLDITLTSQRTAALDALLEQRIKGSLKAQDFIARLNTPQRGGGAGLRIRTALKISDKLESLMGNA